MDASGHWEAPPHTPAPVSFISLGSNLSWLLALGPRASYLHFPTFSTVRLKIPRLLVQPQNQVEDWYKLVLSKPSRVWGFSLVFLLSLKVGEERGLCFPKREGSSGILSAPHLRPN